MSHPRNDLQRRGVEALHDPGGRPAVGTPQEVNHDAEA